MKSCNDGRNVSNDGEEDAYDTLLRPQSLSCIALTRGTAEQMEA